MAKSQAPDVKEIGLTLEDLRALVWSEFQNLKFLVALCRQMRHGEIRITVHDGTMKEIALDLRFRDTK